VDTGVGDQVGLELGDIDVQGTIETEGGGQGGDHLSDESVKAEAELSRAKQHARMLTRSHSMLDFVQDQDQLSTSRMLGRMLCIATACVLEW